MQLAQFGMKPLANNVAITHNHCSNKRIRTDLAAPELRKLKSSSQVRPVSACELGVHATD
jgi:hypothetical protein